MKKHLVLLVSIALALVSYLHAGNASADSSPNDEAVSTELKKSLSSINITFETTAQEITAVLNQMIGKEIYRGSTRTGGLDAEILRNGPLVVTAADNCLYLVMPVTMSLRYGGFKTPAVSSSLRFRLSASITSDWKINADIRYMGLSDLFSEEVGVGLMSIKPRGIIDGITGPLQKAISSLVSRKINEKYSLKAEVGKVWTAAQKPVQLKSYNAWMKIIPQEVMLYPIFAANNQVRLSIGLRSFAELVVGPQPPAQAPVPLPELKTGTAGDKSFRISLDADLFYKDIVAIAAPLLLDKEFGSDGNSIIIKGLDIYSSGDKLAVKVEATGSYNGVFYLTCRPSFNPQTSIFSVEDVDFDMDTRNILLKTANWLMHGKIRNIIKEKLEMNLTQRMQQVREMTQKVMGNLQLAENIFLRGSVRDIKLHDVAVQKEKISIRVFAEGETTVHFESLHAASS